MNFVISQEQTSQSGTNPEILLQNHSKMGQPNFCFSLAQAWEKNIEETEKEKGEKKIL